MVAGTRAGLPASAIAATATPAASGYSTMPGWHVSPRLRIPDGIRLCFLPPYTPELQPAERLWPLTDEAVANKPFATIEELTETLDRCCSALADQPAIVSVHTSFHWRPAE